MNKSAEASYSGKVNKYAAVAAEDTLFSFDKEFGYEIPDELSDAAMPGCRVKIPFGNGRTERVGVILSRYSEEEYGKTKMISSVLDKAPLLSSEMISLVRFMHERYFCTLFDAVKVILPAGLRYKMKTVYSKGQAAAQNEKQSEILSLLSSPLSEEELLIKSGAERDFIREMLKSGILEAHSETKRNISDAHLKSVRALPYDGELTAKGKAAYSCMQEMGQMSVREVCYYSGVTEGVLKTLVKRGAAEFFEAPVFRNPYANLPQYEDKSEIKLSKEQESVFSGLCSELNNKNAKPALLFGVTGSGKTSVYLKLIDEVLGRGQGVIVMVPEISLTPQSVSIFHARYGACVAVFHSALSAGERLDEWKRVKSGEARIVIGTRSAVFAPIENLGLIVMDEEHEYTYKSEQSPKYHARDIAKFRAKYSGALLLMCSATPSVESMYLAKSGVYSLYTLKERFGEASLPIINIVDMNEERMDGNASQYSSALCRAIEERLKRKEQSILLLNRRGFNTFAVCTVCKEVVSCPRCSISLTYHSANHRLICHYCGYSQPEIHECPSCKNKSLSYRGFGTQRAESELSELFPQARILRIDTDSAMTRTAFENYMDGFRRGEYDILVGTQMVAKGLDFENVTLSAVLSADQALFADDFRSNERAFDLFTQVIGRAGRGKLSGEAIIQTFTPESHIIELSQTGDYESFYKDEIEFRRTMLYPPFSDFCVIVFVGEDGVQTRKCAENFLSEFTAAAKRDFPKMPLRVLFPAAASVAVINNKYRYKLLIKCRNGKDFRSLLGKLLMTGETQKEYKNVSISADINPDIVI